jgi:paraquat-inducible protein A
MPPGGSAACPRCGAVLHRDRPDSLNRTLALTVAGVILFVTANSFPFLAMKMQGQVTETRLFSGAVDLFHQDMRALAVLVLITTIIIPALQLGLMLYVLVPLKLGRTPWKLAPVFRTLRELTPWAMMEVFMLGVLVAQVKLADMATMVPGISLWAFALLIIVLAWMQASLDPHTVWERVRYRR